MPKASFLKMFLMFCLNKKNAKNRSNNKQGLILYIVIFVLLPYTRVPFSFLFSFFFNLCPQQINFVLPIYDFEGLFWKKIRICNVISQSSYAFLDHTETTSQETTLYEKKSELKTTCRIYT